MNGAKDQQSRINEAISDCSWSNFRLMVAAEAGVATGERDVRMWLAWRLALC